MRIAHVTAPAQFGGLERVVLGLARAQRERGHEVMVVAVISPGTATPPWLTALEESGVRVEVHPVGNRAYLAERRLVRRLLKEMRAEVVHTHGYRSDVLHLGVARGLGIPVVSTAHGFASQGPGLSLHERVQVYAWRRVNRVVAVSEPLRQHLVRLGVPPARIAQIRNGSVGSPGMLGRAAARRDLGLPMDASVIGWVGRMSGEKDPLLAVEALAQSGGANVHLCFVGDGPLRSACLERGAALGLASRVHADGSRPEAARYLAAFDLLVLSSRTEGTPMTILEAAMASVPIVATAVGGVPDVVQGDGALVPSGDAGLLASAVREVLEDPAAAAIRSDRLRTRLMREEATDDWVGAYEALYRSLSATPSGATSPAPSSP